MPKRAARKPEPVIKNSDLIEAMNTAVLEMTPKKCKHVPKEDELLNTDCDDCVRETEVKALRERLALEIEDDEIKELVLGTPTISLRKTLPPLPTDLKVTIRKSRGYSGWFWDVEKAHDYFSDGEIYWRHICRGGYSFTHRGARWASQRAIRKYYKFNMNSANGKNGGEYYVSPDGATRRLTVGGIPLPSRM